MKKRFFVIIFCTVLLLFNQIATAATVSDKEAGYISLNGSTVKEVEPNVAKVTFSIENNGQSAKLAAEENNKTSNAIIEALKQKTNVQTDIIRTTNFSVRPVYSTTSSGKSVIKHYTAVNAVSVETKDINKVSDLIDTAISSGANKVNGLTFSYDNEKEVCSKLSPEIVRNLRSEASILALAAGTTLDGLKHISSSCNIDSVASNGRFYGKSSSMDMAEESGVSTPVESGKVKIRVYVNAEFYVK